MTACFYFQHIAGAIWTVNASIRLVYLLSKSVKVKTNDRASGYIYIHSILDKLKDRKLVENK